MLQVISGYRKEPVFGICMGNQLMGLAAGGKTFKLPLGNRYCYYMAIFTGPVSSELTRQPFWRTKKFVRDFGLCAQNPDKVEFLS